MAIARRDLLCGAAALLLARTGPADAQTPADPAFVYAPGTFVVIGKQPDGDSVRFIPDDASALSAIRRAHLLRPSHDGSLQLRLDGIDAPETHYNGHAQPFGDAARDRLLIGMLGFQSLIFGAHRERVLEAEPATLRGAILTRSADPHGRPICYVLNAGEAAPIPTQSGSVGTDLVCRTVNLRMVGDGYAYPLLYSSTPRAHRALFALAARTARMERQGVWALDGSADFMLPGFAAIDEGHPDARLIFPKLYRRAVDCLRATAKGFQGDLIDWLQATPGENDIAYSDATGRVRLADLLRRDADRLRFIADPADLVFIER